MLSQEQLYLLEQIFKGTKANIADVAKGGAVSPEMLNTIRGNIDLLTTFLPEIGIYSEEIVALEMIRIAETGLLNTRN